MNRISFVMSVIMVVSAWYQKAASDGAITAPEVAELLNEIASATGHAGVITAHVKSTEVAT